MDFMKKRFRNSEHRFFDETEAEPPTEGGVNLDGDYEHRTTGMSAGRIRLFWMRRYFAL